MPTSGNTVYGYTAGQLMNSAACELGAVGMGDSLKSSEEAEMQRRLNGMLAKWSTDMNMFRETSGTLTITGATGAATLPNDVRGVRSVRHVISSTNKRPLAEWNRDEFYRLPNRTTAGNPSAYFLASGVEAYQIYIWPVPALSITLELDYNRAFYIVEAPEQTIDLPPEWYEALLYGLAARSANIFGTTNIAPQTIARIDTQARDTYQKLLDGDRPDSYYFEYDSPVEAR